MLNHTQRIVIALIFSLTFLGQALASSVSAYHMVNMTNMAMNEPSHQMMMDHGNHQMPVADDNQTSEDCCEKECSCLISGCLSVLALTESLTPLYFAHLTDKIPPPAAPSYIQQPTSLYRPPILS